MPDAPISVAAVDDHPVVLHGVAHVLAVEAEDMRLDLIEASIEALLRRQPDLSSVVVLLDLLLPGEPDVAANVRRVRAAGAQVVAFTSDSRPAVVRTAVDAGALGVVLKGDPESAVAEAVRAAHAGEFFVSSRFAYAMVTDPRASIRLSPREKEVLTLVANGLPYKVIAKRIGISVQTLPSYLRRVAARYAAAGAGQPSPSELVALAVRDGHIDLTR